MKYSLEDLADLINDNFYENSTQAVTGAMANEVCIALIDSFAGKTSPMQSRELNIMTQDLDANQQVDITHELDTMDLKIVLYNEKGERIYREKYDFMPADNDTVTLTFFSGIPYRRSYKGYIYKAA